jgi:alpha-D-ribose 1-methylphosphonate 5-triphosphate synthase subunit PhnG
MSAVDDFQNRFAQTDRAGWMAVLARATRDELRTLTGGLDLPAVDIVKQPECGSLMIEARAGGGGRRFNACEATVTRCVVRYGELLGYSYSLGRDKEKARIAAILDAMLQSPSSHKMVMQAVVAPLASVQHERRARASLEAAATKVDFFTMVRGDG